MSSLWHNVKTKGSNSRKGTKKKKTAKKESERTGGDE